MKQFGFGSLFLSMLLALVFLGLPLAAEEGADDATLAKPNELVARAVADFEKLPLAELEEVVQSLDRTAADHTWKQRHSPPEEVLRWITELIACKRQVDSHLENLLKLRGGIAALSAGASQKQSVQRYLLVTSRLIDLSGRLHCSLGDAIENATFDLSRNLATLNQLVDLLIAQNVSVGAHLMTFALFDPDKASKLDPFPVEFKKKVLQLAAATRNAYTLPDLARFVLEEHPAPELLLDAAEAIRAIGLPQNPRPGQDPTLALPEITAAALARVVTEIPAAKLSAELQGRRDELITWLVQREKSGVAEDTYRVGESEVRAGDWLLMRNPTPFNQLTTPMPGLFTQAGVVTVEQGSDGQRRFVVVDLPEEGPRVPATNAEIFLLQPQHYVFLRHSDATVASRMGEAVKNMIGSEMKYDFQFRSDRITALKGRALRGQPIHTYGAGLLLICAQAAEQPRRDFFPLRETIAGGNCLANLAPWGISIGSDFVSPTGAIFSQKLEIVGRSEPMYDPVREIQDAVYDHFAVSLVNKRLALSPTLSKALQEKFAKLPSSKSLFGRFFSRPNPANEQTEQHVAARATVAIETLEDIAEANANEFRLAREALLSEDESQQANDPKPDPKLIQQTRMYRQRHASIYQRLREGKATALDLRRELVKFYTAQSKQQLDERFFR